MPELPALTGVRLSREFYSGERRGFDGPRHWRITYPAAMTRDAIMAELVEIEGLGEGKKSKLLLAANPPWTPAEDEKLRSLAASGASDTFP